MEHETHDGRREHERRLRYTDPALSEHRESYGRDRRRERPRDRLPSDHDCGASDRPGRGGRRSSHEALDPRMVLDAAVRLLARIVHGADVAGDEDAAPESRGLKAVAEGFHLLGLDDHRQLELCLPVYDALYAWCRAHV